MLFSIRHPPILPKKCLSATDLIAVNIPGCSISLMVITCEWMLETFVLLKPNKGNQPILS